MYMHQRSRAVTKCLPAGSYWLFDMLLVVGFPIDQDRDDQIILAPLPLTRPLLIRHCRSPVPLLSLPQPLSRGV